ncbi:MAG TPA: deoxyribonuclease IV [Candidatus Babeliales bacterium]|nr:deoxyribonuclease IV [Candidatus Babeliales bacterium]
MSKPAPLLLGAHLSISGGLEQALITGAQIGCTAIQIFTKSNRQWQARPITAAAAALFQRTQEISGVQVVGAHASYLINLAAPNLAIQHKSVTGLAVELQRCTQLQIPYLILHPGNGLGLTDPECARLIATNIDHALAASPGQTKILLENMAGQGTSFGTHFNQLAAIYQHVKHKARVGFCLDTCHAWAAGYDWSTPAGYDALWRDFTQNLNLAQLHFIHLNDSKQPLGSQVDRHEHIGQGQIGLAAFKLLMNDQRFWHIPKILETPKAHDVADDVKNLTTLVNLLTPANAALIRTLKLAEYLK